MASSTAIGETALSRQFDSFAIFYTSMNINGTNAGTSCMPYIQCYDKEELVGIILFYENQPPPTNTYRGSHPHYRFHITFHISRFNDIINILRYHKPLSLNFDLIRKDGSLETSERQHVGEQ